MFSKQEEDLGLICARLSSAYLEMRDLSNPAVPGTLLALGIAPFASPSLFLLHHNYLNPKFLKYFPKKSLILSPFTLFFHFLFQNDRKLFQFESKEE